MHLRFNVGYIIYGCFGVSLCLRVGVCVGVSYRADLWLVWCLFDVVLRFT